MTSPETGPESRERGRRAAVSCLRVDVEDRIVSVDDAWKDWAEKEGEPALVDSVVGTDLWRYLSDLAVQQIYAEILKRVRETGRTVRFPFRCDAPDRRRFMQMEVARDGEEVEFRSWTESEVAREAVRLLNPTASSTDAKVVVCAWCRRVRVEEGEWLEVEEALPRLDLFGEDPVPGVSHGICPDCRSRVVGEAA